MDLVGNAEGDLAEVCDSADIAQVDTMDSCIPLYTNFFISL